VAGELQPQRSIHKAVSRLFFLLLYFSSFDDTMTELGLDAGELNETVLHLNLGLIVLVWFGLVFFVFSPLMR
jgi:hypothetical protein